MADYTLDARNMLCPLPVIRTQDKIMQCLPGDTVQVTCTDPGALNDIPAWCRINGHAVVNMEEQDGLVVITVQVGNDHT